MTGVVRRSEATAGNLSAAIRSAAAGEGTLPPDLLGRLLRQVGPAPAPGAVAARADVLGPDRARGRGRCGCWPTGYDTAEVAQPAVLLGAHGQEHHPRRHVAPGAAQPDARRGVRDPRGAHLGGGPRRGPVGPLVLLDLLAAAPAASGRSARPGFCSRWGGPPSGRELPRLPASGAGCTEDITSSAVSLGGLLEAVGRVADSRMPPGARCRRPDPATAGRRAPARGPGSAGRWAWRGCTGRP